MTNRRLIVALVLATLASLPQQAAAQADVSGVWMRQHPGNGFSESPPPPMTTWATARFEANRPTVGPRAALDANDPTLDCVPPGMPYILAVPTPFEFVQTGREIIQLFEYNHFVRRIRMDLRTHPAELKDTGGHEWLGHSIGWWEGDVLVIDTVGFNDTTWLDRLGHPHSDALHLVERIRRLDQGTLEYVITVEDEKAYTRAWTGRLLYTRRPDWRILEHVCVAAGDEYQAFKDRAWEPAPATAPSGPLIR
jgi:hypothetical protein